MNHYCTYFDRGYLPQGLALWRSLARHDSAARLTVLALDRETERVLQALGEAQLSVMSLADLLSADAELAAAQVGRSRREFIFTLTPCLMQRLLSTSVEGECVAYLDADLFFFGPANVIWHELGEGSVLTVPHRYPPWHDDAARYGRFNVGVVAARNDANGRACMRWWRQRCLESAALAADGERYGDQKYLDQWPRRFDGVVVAEHSGVNVAPWNWAGLRLDVRRNTITVNGRPLIVFHFAQFRRIRDRWYDSGQLEYGVMPQTLRTAVYAPYAQALGAAEQEIRRYIPDFSGLRTGWRAALGPWHLALLRWFWGQYWREGETRWTASGLGLGRYSGHFMAYYRRWRRPAP